MVLAVFEDDLLSDLGLLDARRQSPADAAALAGLDEVVLRPCVKRVLAIDKLGVEHHVALLRRLRFEIGQPLPRLQIPGAGDAALRHGCSLQKGAAAEQLATLP